MTTSALESDRSERHRVVIVGGGFGGVYAARGLRRAPVDVVLIDRRNFHTFSPMLYQAATGAVSPSEVSQPLRAMLRRQRNARVILGEVTDLDAAQRQLTLSDGTSIDYDSLVVATGTQPSYFGHEDWSAHAPGLKTLEDATELRRRALVAFETAEREPDAERRRPWMTLVVVGGGPTGVELAGALAELARQTMRNEFRSFDPREARIVLVEAVNEILPGWPEFLRAAARDNLEELGVEIRTGTRVEDVGPTHVDVLAGEEVERIATRTAFWAAGVRPSAFGRRVARALAAPTDRVGRIVVEPDLSVRGHPEVFVVGDLAAISRPDGEPVPDVAQKGIQGGKHVARVIAERLRNRPAREFRYFDWGDLAMVGRFRVVARFPFLALTGFVAWVTWLGVHLFYLNGVQTRLVVSLRWLWTLFTNGRGSRLITGSHDTYGALPPIGSLDGTKDLPGVGERRAA